MGRIIPYIMENKSHVPNHQPVDIYKSTLYDEILWNNGTSQNQCLYTIKWETNSMVSDVDSIPWKIVYQFLSYPRFEIQFMPINAQVDPSNPIQTLHHQSKKCQHQLLMVALTLNWYEDPQIVIWSGEMITTNGEELCCLAYVILFSGTKAKPFPMIFPWFSLWISYVLWVFGCTSTHRRTGLILARKISTSAGFAPVGKELIGRWQVFGNSYTIPVVTVITNRTNCVFLFRSSLEESILVLYIQCTRTPPKDSE
jgi:hypothetical protein